MAYIVENGMTIEFRDFGSIPMDRLRDRLGRAADLRCETHGSTVVAVTIFGRENGWFDSMWTTCCEQLEQAASAIVRNRC